MKQGIHPEYTEAVIVCSCGNRIETRSTQEEIHVEICAVCHPFYTGRQKLVDTAGRVERFKRKYGDVSSGADVDEDEAPEAGEAGEAAEASGSEEEAPAPGEGGEEPEAADEGRPRAAAAEEPSGETSEKPEAANA